MVIEQTFDLCRADWNGEIRYLREIQQSRISKTAS